MPPLNNNPSAPRATLSVCPCCGQFNFPPPLDCPIGFTLEGGRSGLFTASQEAALFRFISYAPGPVIEAMLARALGSNQVSRTLKRIRKRIGWKGAICCVNVPKVTGPGGYGEYTLAPGIRVWEPEDKGGSVGA